MNFVPVTKKGWLQQVYGTEKMFTFTKSSERGIDMIRSVLGESGLNIK